MSSGARVASAGETETMLSAARVFAAITAQSIAQAGSGVTLPQLRVLVRAAERHSLSATEVARELAVHLSTASRICDKLVQGGYLNRRDRPEDRRHLELTITESGTSLLAAVTDHRRSVFDRILGRMTLHDRAALTDALGTFVAASQDQVGSTDLP